MIIHLSNLKVIDIDEHRAWRGYHVLECSSLACIIPSCVPIRAEMLLHLIDTFVIRLSRDRLFHLTSDSRSQPAIHLHSCDSTHSRIWPQHLDFSVSAISRLVWFKNRESNDREPRYFLIFARRDGWWLKSKFISSFSLTLSEEEKICWIFLDIFR